MGEVITKLRIETDEYQNRVRRAAASLNDMGHQCERAGNSIAILNKDNIKLAKSLGSMQTVSTSLRGKMNELSQAFVDASHHYNQLTAAEKRSQYGQYLTKSIEQLKLRLREAQTELRGLESEAAGSGKHGFAKQFASSLVPGLGMGVGAAGAMAAVKGITLAIGALKDTVSDAIRTNTEFEQANANLAAVLGKTRSEISALTDNAKQLGATTIYTAGQITELQTVLARRGFNEAQILQMTRGISNLATATGTDLADAAELAGSTMQAFGMHASEMERIVSALGVSTTKSALTTDKLQTSLAYVAPAARAAGFNLEETIAMLGALADSGIPATTAGVAVRNILVHLSTDASKLSKAIGHPVRSLKEFTEALEDLNARGYNDLDHISKLVEKRIIPGFSIFMNNAEKLNDLRDSIVGVEEELQKMADEQLNTLHGSTVLMQSAWDGLMLTFSEGNGILKDTYDWITGIINKTIEYRKLKQGGASAESLYDKGPNSELAESRYRVARSSVETSVREANKKANADEVEKQINIAIGNSLQAEIDDAKTLYNTIKDIDDVISNISSNSSFWDDQDAKKQYQWNRLNALNKKYGFATPNEYGVVDWDKMLPVIRGEMSSNIATLEMAKGIAEAAISGATPVDAGEELDDNLLEEVKKNVKQVTSLGRLGYLEDLANTIRNSMNGADTTEEYREMESELERVKQQIKELKGEMDEAFEPGSLEWLNDLLKKYQENLKKCVYGTEEWYAATLEIKDLQAAISVAQGKGVKETENSADSADDVEASWGKAAKAVGKVGGALSGLENPAARVTGIIGQAIANIAAGYAAAVEKAGATGDAGGPWGWIAFAAAGAATMISSIAAIKSATEYHADGGFVGMNGMKRGTDIVPAMLTPGELVLNQAQQGALANQLQGGWGNLHIEKVIGAEEIRLILTNNNRRRQRSSAITI